MHLAQTTKMPCLSWGIPPATCITGQKLRRKGEQDNVPYVCRLCYAQQGHFQMPLVAQRLEENRKEYFLDPKKWVQKITRKIWAGNCLYFRFFHAGDLQSPAMLSHIFDVAEECPETKFWVPTMERGFVAEVVRRRDVPLNVVVRLTAHRIDQKTPPRFSAPGICYSRVVYNQPANCPAHKQNSTCGRCRKCWDREKTIISYPLKVGRHYWPYQTAKRLGL